MDEARLRAALANDELVLHYQPKVDLASRRLLGFEALVRWTDPDTGELVLPGAFIPLAERSGLIDELGARVLARALAQAARWREVAAIPEDFFLCVNVSSHQFDADLARAVATAVRDAGADPSQLVLELTESALMVDVEAAVSTMQALKYVGVRIALDDFGTGYSSLAYLKRLPLDELKVDRAFVAGLGADTGDTAIVGAIVALGHALGLVVVAEGVETDVQAAALVAVGCDAAQGYRFGRPVPAEEATRLLVPPFMPGDREGGAMPQARLVLVVDDAADMRQLACVSLSTAGFDAREASSGDEALALAAALRPGCIVLDLSMPGIGGIDTCRRLRTSPATGDAAIVIVSSHADAAAKVEAFSAGADDYIVKPFSPRELVAHVRDAIGRRAASP